MGSIRVFEKEGKQLVSAKELYIGLGLRKSEWSRWAKRNIVDNEFFKENKDWLSLVPSTNDNKRGNFAKHLAMTARTEKYLK